MLSDKQIECPNNLLKAAKDKKNVAAAIVNAGKPLPMHSAMEAVKKDLIIPIFIGDKKEINKCAAQLNWDISKFKIVHEPVENNTAPIAAVMLFFFFATFSKLLGHSIFLSESIFNYSRKDVHLVY